MIYFLIFLLIGVIKSNFVFDAKEDRVSADFETDLSSENS